MREVIDNAQYAPTAGRFKVYIIDEVHMLSKSAFNAILKTLEEPPAHVKFILATTDPQKVPVTVLSRCLQFNLRQIPPPVVASHLQYVLHQENIPFEPAALALLGHAAAGSMRDSLSLLDQAIAYGSGKVEEAGVRAMLGAIDQTYLLNLLDALVAGDGAALLMEIDRMAERSIGFEAALQDLSALLHRIALMQLAPSSADDLVDVGRLQELAGRLSAEEVQLFYQIAILGRRDLSLAPDEYAGFSMALLRMLAFAPVDPAQREVRRACATAEPPVQRTPDVPARPRAERVAVSTAEPAGILPGEGANPVPAGKAAMGAGQSSAGFDGDWPALVSRLALGGMAKMLAQNCALSAFEDNRISLVLPDSVKHLADRGYQDKLRQALEQTLGLPVQLSVTVGQAEAATPVALQEQAKADRLVQAEQVIRADAFVADMIEQCDARIVDGSIRPLT